MLASDVELNGILGVLHLAVDVGVVLHNVGNSIGQGAAHVRVVSAAVESGNLASELNDVLVNGLAAVELGRLVVNIALSSRQVAGDSTGVGQQVVVQFNTGTEGALQEVEGQLGVLAVGGNGPACAAAVCVVELVAPSMPSSLGMLTIAHLPD